jgi:mRNA interferase MazF
VDWNPASGSEQAGRRPALVIQADAGNTNPNYPNTIVAAISTARARVPTHIEIDPSTTNGLRDTSSVKCEQLVTISKDRLQGRIGQLTDEELHRVNGGLQRAIAIP